MFNSFWLRSLSFLDFHLLAFRRRPCFAACRRRSYRNWLIEALEKRTLLSTITVTSSLDTVDSMDGFTTLREAILQANAEGGHDTIEFNIEGDGVHTIQVRGSDLPTITDSVTIDATTQSGYAGAPVIELDGTFAGSLGRGFEIVAGNSTIRGFAINRFVQDGIYIHGGGGNLIVGNFIGTDVTGTVDLGNNVQGVRIKDSSNNVIGGTEQWDRNVISGNNANGVVIGGNYSSGNVVWGNFIGTDVTGNSALGNRLNGVLVGVADNNVVGGTADGAGNVIAGNGWHGVWIAGGAAGNAVEGNFIGTNASGAVLGNSMNGVYIFDSAGGNVVGGNSAAAGNVIAFNAGNGVTVYQSTSFNNTVRANSIHSNGGLNVDLGDDGATANDAGDADSGPNMYHNFPVLAAATENTVETHVEGSFDGAADVSVTLDFYAGDGNGDVWLGSVVVTTDAAGHADFSVSLSLVAEGGHLVTATATDDNGSTSEYSSGVTVVSVDPPPPPAPEPPPAPPTVEERIGGLIDRVNNLVEEGELRRRDGRRLTKTLNRALRQLDRERTLSAIQMLRATSFQVRALTRSGRLSEEAGDALRDELRETIQQLREEFFANLLDRFFSRRGFGRFLNRI